MPQELANVSSRERKLTEELTTAQKYSNKYKKRWEGLVKDMKDYWMVPFFRDNRSTSKAYVFILVKSCCDALCYK